MIEEALLLVFVVLLLFVIGIIYRDSQVSQKIKAVESAIEVLHRDGFKIEKNLSKELTELVDSSSGKTALALEGLEKMLEDLKDEFELSQMKVARLEEKINEFLAVPNASGFDASRAISLHNMGYTVEDISKELRVSVNEISLALKLNNLEPRRAF